MDQSILSEIKGDLLIVDDDLPGLRLLSNLLADHGYEVRSARDGSSALMMVAAAPPDMILLDIQMPDMDGYQVCRQLKANPTTRDIPVLFISARDSVFDTVNGFEVGGVDYINKPYREEEILARIRTHLTIASLQGSLVVRLKENEHLTEQLRRAAVDAERQRLARELHDSVTQSIYSLTLLSSGWESMARQGTLEDPASSFQRLGALGQQVLREMRLLVHQMRAPTLEEEGLVNALQQRLDAVETRANIDAQLQVCADLTALTPAVEDELFKIAQEALNNSLKHARATTVKVAIKEEQGKITLSVEDDGIGFDTSKKYGGMGLGNMVQRADAVAAAFTLYSASDRGTQVTITVDLTEE